MCRNALAQAQQAAAQAIASKGKDGITAGDDKKSPVKQEPGADSKDGVKPPQVPRWGESSPDGRAVMYLGSTANQAQSLHDGCCAICQPPSRNVLQGMKA